MPYGTLAVDTIVPTNNLAISGNVISTGTLASGAGTTYPLIRGTSQTASGSSVDFTGIPSWVNRITLTLVDLNYAATTGSSRIRIGSGSLATTGYTTSGVFLAAATPTYSSVTDGLGFAATSSTVVANAVFILVHLGNNVWVSSATVNRSAESAVQVQTGKISLSGTLDRISLVTTISTFTSGTVNILYE